MPRRFERKEEGTHRQAIRAWDVVEKAGKGRDLAGIGTVEKMQQFAEFGF